MGEQLFLGDSQFELEQFFLKESLQLDQVLNDALSVLAAPLLLHEQEDVLLDRFACYHLP